MCLKLPFILLFSIYAWIWLFDVFCRILGLFTQNLTLNGCILTSRMDAYVLLRPCNGKRVENRFQPRLWLDCDACYGPWWEVRLLLLCFPLDVWLKKSSFSYKRASCNKSKQEKHNLSSFSHFFFLVQILSLIIV